MARVKFKVYFSHVYIHKVLNSTIKLKKICIQVYYFLYI